jgi:membrane protein
MAARFLPDSAYQLVDQTVREITTGPQLQLISVGAIVAVWSATNAMRSIMDALNAAYEVRDDRPVWKWLLVSIALTFTLAVLSISALVVLMYGRNIGDLLASRFGLSGAFQTLWTLFEWPFIAGCILLALALVYRYAPDMEYIRWKWIVPGAVVGTLLWLAVSFGFRLYLAHFDTYNKTYGSLGAVIILMFWFYLTGAAVLIGGEVNSELEYAAARAGDPEAKLPGEKTPGERRRG